MQLKGVKQKVLKVEEVQRKKHVCPNCMKPSLKRVAAGIWQCKKCRFKFAGKAYKPS
jgi:large subunit ribosomal protein L37Ae